MSEDSELIALIDLIYAAVLDADLWPTVLAKLADATGTMQAIIATMDRRTDTFASISRRAYPDLEASYKDYWAFRNPLWDNATALPAGELFSLDTLMPRQDFAKTPVFNEWWKTADYGLEMLGANLPVADRVSSVICVVNARRSDALTSEQTRVFETAVRHVSRAVRVHRQLWTLDLMHDTAPERFESLRQGAILVDAAANVLFTNAPARAVLETGEGLVLKGGCLASTDGADTLQRLIASCARGVGPMRGPLGGELDVRRGPNRPCLHVSVTPLRSKDPATGMPWLGLRPPAAIVTVVDPETGRRQLAQNLHNRFGLTGAETGLAAEILKGDGRAAAARRRGISVATVRAQLSSIFEKTGTHRQAELIHLLLELADKREPEKWEV
ncbi:MAG TPA: helix-turn-helix transcriptional regulator [Methylocella sp.]